MSKIDVTKVSEFMALRQTDYDAFITGSFAYGIPHQNSDIDLVILSDGNIKHLLEQADEIDTRIEYANTGSFSLKFGNLNLLICLTVDVYKQWQIGTEYLKQKAPVSRDYAVMIFNKIRNGEDLNGSSS